MAGKAKTHRYDPRFDRAQTVGGAKARYISDDVDYSLDDMERDLHRLLAGESYPDANPKEDATRELFTRGV